MTTARRAWRRGANWASASERESPILSSAGLELALRHRKLDHFGDEDGPGQQDAKARPIITALTRMSADRNSDHGEQFAQRCRLGLQRFLPLLVRDVAASAPRCGRGLSGDGGGACTTGGTGA